MANVTNLSDRRIRKSNSNLKHRCITPEKELSDEFVANDDSLQLKIGSFQNLIYKYEKLFYNFSRENVKTDEAFAWMSFLTNHFRILVLSLEEGSVSREAKTTIDHLERIQDMLTREHILNHSK